jgi:hypothetical protein
VRPAGLAREAAAGIEAIVTQSRGHRDVGDSQLSFGVPSGAPRREGGPRRRRYRILRGEVAEGALEGTHLLGDVLPADIEVESRRTAHGAVELDPGLAEPVPRQVSARRTAEEEGGHPPGGADARLGLAQAADRRRRAGQLPRQVLSHEVEAGTRERPDRVVRLLHQLAPEKFADVAAYPQVHDQRQSGAGIAGVLKVSADQVAAEALRRSVIGVVLVGGVVEQPLVLGVETQHAEGRTPGDREDQLRGAGPLLAAVVRERIRHRGARIAPIARGGRAHRVRIHPSRDVHRGDEADPPRQRTAGAQREPVQPPIEPAAERPVPFVREPTLPLLAGLTRHHVHQAGERLTVARGEPVGDQRRLAEEVRRDLEAESTARGVELVLHPEPVEDERFLADPPTAIAGADAAGGQRDRLLQRADRKIAQVLGGEPLLGARRERVQPRVVRCGDHQRLELEGIGFQIEVHRDRGPRRNEHAVEHDAAVTDETRGHLVPSGANRAHAVAPGGVGDRADALVHQDLNGGEPRPRIGPPDLAGDGALGLGGGSARAAEGDAGKEEERGEQSQTGHHWAPNR